MVWRNLTIKNCSMTVHDIFFLFSLVFSVQNDLELPESLTNTNRFVIFKFFCLKITFIHLGRYFDFLVVCPF